MNTTTHTNRRQVKKNRRGAFIMMTLSGVVATITMAASLNTTLGATVAEIINNNNTAGSQLTHLMEEYEANASGTVVGAALCTSTGNGANATGVNASGAVECSYNKYGDGTFNLSDTNTKVSYVAIKNAGPNTEDNVYLTPDTCTLTRATGANTTADACADYDVTISRWNGTTWDTTAVDHTAPATMASTNYHVGSLTAGTTAVFKFEVSVPNSTTSTTLMGQSITQNLSWTFENAAIASHTTL